MTARLGWAVLAMAAWLWALGAGAAAHAQGEDASAQATQAQQPAEGSRTLEQLMRAADEESRERERARTAPALAQRLGLPLPAAARLASLLPLEDELCDYTRWENREEPTAAIQGLESKFIALMSVAPDNPGLAGEVHDFYRRCGGYTEGTAVLDLIAKAKDPPAIAIHLAGVDLDRRERRPAPGEDGTDPTDDRTDTHDRSTDFLLAALAVRPDAIGLWFYAARATSGPEWKIALFEQAVRSLLSSETVPPAKRTAAAAAVAESLLTAAIDTGLAGRAMAELRGLPPAVRTLVESGKRGYVNVEVGGIFFRPRLSDLRLELGMAATLSGDLPAARALLAGFDASRASPARSSNRGAPPRGKALARRLLDSWLLPSAEDPFDLLTTAVGLYQQLGDRSLNSIGWHLTLARAAVREGYPGIAAYVLPRAADAFLMLDPVQEPAPTGRDVPPKVLHSAQGLVAEVEALRETVEAETAAARAAMRDALGPDPAGPAIARWLAQPPGPPFAARHLPPGIQPLDLSPAQRAAARARIAESLHVPVGWNPVRAGRQETEVAVIARSYAYDPPSTGAQDGGYWVLRSSDGGKTWRRPLYTGLRVNLPYTVREESALPLLAGDRLNVEVEIEPIDDEPSHIAAELARRPGQQGLYLEIPFAELERDTDGDGLTDLAERRLLTDPGNPDTNGDGTLDGSDRMPGVPRGDPAAPAARFIATLVEDTGIREWPTLSAMTPDTLVSFAVGERRWFSGLHPSRRLIVLTQEEYRALSKQISLPIEAWFQILVFDRVGRRAFVLDGGARTYEDRDGAWREVR
ncbi:MAG: hypothetical protein JOZ15_05490 [Acidobacteria bacterium]|nr:hypothetical protein [Acidobacteriota bacterium]